MLLALLGAGALTTAHFYAEPLRWAQAYLARRYAWQRIRDLYLATALASYLLPFKMGIPLRVGLALQVTRLDPGSLVALMAADGFIMLSCWSGIALAVGGVQAHSLLPRVDPAWLILAVFILGLSLASFGYVRWRKRASDAPRFFGCGVGAVPIAIAIGVVDVLSYGPRHGLIALGMGLDPMRFWTWSALGIIATFSGILSGLPMGLLGYDGVLLASYTAAGAEPSKAVLVLLCNRLLSFAVAAGLGVPAARRLGIGAGIHQYWRRLREMVRAE
ncbi:MAG: hypothetical protein QJR02_13470 [Sinobacteraceae bacterium]|nr:hypothetical protein [Nevskiaceae bacterium]